MNLLKEIFIVLKKERIIFLKQICSSLLIASLLCSHLGLARPNNQQTLDILKMKGLITQEEYALAQNKDILKLAENVTNIPSINSPESKKLLLKVVNTLKEDPRAKGTEIAKVSKRELNHVFDQATSPSNLNKINNFTASSFLEDRNCRSTTASFAKRNLPLRNNLPSFEDEDQILSSNVINQSFVSVFKASSKSDLKNKLASNNKDEIQNLRVNHQEEINSNSRYVVCNNRSLKQEMIAFRGSLKNIQNSNLMKSLQISQLPKQKSLKTQFLSFLGMEKKQVESRNIASFDWGLVVEIIKWVLLVIIFVFLVGACFSAFTVSVAAVGASKVMLHFASYVMSAVILLLLKWIFDDADDANVSNVRYKPAPKPNPKPNPNVTVYINGKPVHPDKKEHAADGHEHEVNYHSLPN